MHFDGIGPYDNDEARELLEDVRAGAFDPALMIPGKHFGYLDEEMGALLVALISLAAASDDELPEGITPEHVATLREQDTQLRLRDAQDAVLADGTVSGLYAHWDKEGKVHEWKALSYQPLGLEH